MGFPVVLNLAGRLCLVAGAGPVGRRRSTELLAAGAGVRLVAPELPDADLPAAVEQRCRVFREEDLEGVFFALAATSDAATNDSLVQAARCRGILCGRADRPQEGDLLVPAVLRRGDLTLAVSTEGSSPLLAALLRERLEQQLGAEWGPLTQLAGALRQEALRCGVPAATQRQWLKGLLDNGIEAALAAADDQRVRQLLVRNVDDEGLAVRLTGMIGEHS